MGNFNCRQRVSLIVVAHTTNATITELTLGGQAAATTTRLVLPNNSTYSFRGLASDGDAKAWRFEGTIERGANAANSHGRNGHHQQRRGSRRGRDE